MGNMVLSFSEAFKKIASTDSPPGLPRITLRHLVYFVAAARNESALRAAQELNVSPPAISVGEPVGPGLFAAARNPPEQQLQPGLQGDDRAGEFLVAVGFGGPGEGDLTGCTGT